jgi:hypothetical protein
MRELLCWVLLFTTLAAGPASVLWLTLLTRRRSQSLEAAYQTTPSSAPPSTHVAPRLATTGIRRCRTTFASHVPPEDGLVTETWMLACPSAPELPAACDDESAPTACSNYESES